MEACKEDLALKGNGKTSTPTAGEASKPWLSQPPWCNEDTIQAVLLGFSYHPLYEREQ